MQPELFPAVGFQFAPMRETFARGILAVKQIVRYQVQDAATGVLAAAQVLRGCGGGGRTRKGLGGGGGVGVAFVFNGRDFVFVQGVAVGVFSITHGGKVLVSQRKKRRVRRRCFCRWGWFSRFSRLTDQVLMVKSGKP